MQKKEAIGISDNDWVPTFDEAVNKIRKIEKKVKNKNSVDYDELDFTVEEEPILLHIENYSFQDMMNEFDRIKKAEATLKFDDILMHPKSEKKSLNLSRFGFKKKSSQQNKIKKSIKTTENKKKAIFGMLRKSKNPKSQKSNKKKVEMENHLQEINSLADIQLIAFARDNLTDLYDDFKSGKKDIKEFRKEVRTIMGKDYKLSNEYLDRISDQPSSFNVE